MRYIFIVDYSKHSGSGHLKRSSYLAKYIKSKNNQIIFFINGNFLDAAINEQISTNKFDKKKISSFDKKNTLIVIDSYHIKKKYVNQLYDKGFKIIFFDDRLTSDYKANILINQNLSFTKKDYKKTKIKKLLVGEKYSIISDNLISIKKRRKLKKKIKDVMIDFGQASSKEMEYFLDYFKFIEKINYFIVLKKNWINFDRLKKILNDNKNIKIIYNSKLYFKTLHNVDLVIGGYGFSEIEKKFLDIPTLAFSLSEDQKIIGLKNKKIQNNYLGDLNIKNIKKLNYLIEKFISDYKFFIKDLVIKMIKVDGKGKTEIYKEILKLSR